MAECNEWVPAPEHGVGSGAIYELKYQGRGFAGAALSPERDPFRFVLANRSDVTLLEVRNVGLVRFGDPIARVIARRSGPALQALPDVLQVPATGPGDVVLDLSEIRLCGYADLAQQERAEDEERETREAIERMDELGPVAGLLERIEDVGQGTALVAGVVLLALLWPFLEDVGRAILEGGTRLWN